MKGWYQSWHLILRHQWRLSPSWIYAHKGSCLDSLLCELLHFQDMKKHLCLPKSVFSGLQGSCSCTSFLGFFLCSVPKPPTRNKPLFSLVILVRFWLSWTWQNCSFMGMFDSCCAQRSQNKKAFPWDGEGLFVCSYLQEAKIADFPHSPKI